MLKDKDLILIGYLRKNARANLTKISKDTKIPVSTLYDRLKHHEEGLVMKHTSIIDFRQLGFNTRMHILLKVNVEERAALKDYLMKHKSINSLYKINSGYDLMAEGIFKDVKEMEDFMERIEKEFKIIKKISYHVIEDIKREEFIPEMASAKPDTP